jgi:hypothetical protein
LMLQKDEESVEKAGGRSSSWWGSEGISIYLWTGQEDIWRCRQHRETAPDHFYFSKNCPRITSSVSVRKKYVIHAHMSSEHRINSLADRDADLIAMSKQPQTKSPKAINITGPSQPFHARRNSASSMYANPDTDPHYQQDPVIGRDANAGENNSQTNNHIIDGLSNQSTQSNR